MDLILPILFLSIPYLLAFLAAVMLIGVAGLSWQFPMLPALAYLAVFFAFSSSTYGLLTATTSTMYTRGSGQLFFPILLWLLFLSVLWLSFSAAFARQPLVEAPRIQKWFWLWFVLLLMHVGWGAATGVPFSESLSQDGFVNLPWMGLLIALMVAGARDEKSINLLSRFIILAGLLKSGFGLVRWATLGGDPANIYANVEKIQVKLTFFEIGDSLVCLLAAAVCASLLFIRKDANENAWWRRIQWVTLLSCLLCIALSYRRTAWVGLFLAAFLLFLKLKPAARVTALLVVFPVMVAGVGFVFLQRLGVQAGKLGALSLVYDLIGQKGGAESARVLELRLAFKEFVTSPIVGLGAWGRYTATMLIPWQDPARPGAFLHSGVLHILMKTGLVGMVLLVGVVGSFMREVRNRHESSAASASLIFAGCCGLLFMLPDFLIGTPVVQFRTTQLIAVCLALPFFVHRVQLLAQPNLQVER